MHTQNLIYIADPSKVISDALSLLLSTYNAEVHVFDDNRKCLEACVDTMQVDCYFMIETQLYTDSQLTILHELRGLGLTTPVIILTDMLTPTFRDQALALGVAEVFELPVMNGFLIERLRQLMPSFGKKYC